MNRRGGHFFTSPQTCIFLGFLKRGSEVSSGHHMLCKETSKDKAHLPEDCYPALETHLSMSNICALVLQQRHPRLMPCSTSFYSQETENYPSISFQCVFIASSNQHFRRRIKGAACHHLQAPSASRTESVVHTS